MFFLLPCEAAYSNQSSISSRVLTCIVHAFICVRIDYCNSLLFGLPKVCLSPLQSVLNAAARIFAQFSHTSHISAFIFDHLHWLPLIARIQLKIATLIYHSHIFQAPSICVMLSAFHLSLSHEQGLLWLRHEPLQSLALHFGTSFLL